MSMIDRPVPPLVVRFGAIGDLIVITPILRALAARYGKPCDVVASGERASQVFRELPFVGTVKSAREKLFRLDTRDLMRWVKARGEGPLFLLESNPKRTRIFEKAGIKVTVSNSEVARLPDEHIISYYFRLCDFHEGDEFYNSAPVLEINSDEAKDCKEWLEHLNCEGHPLVLIQTGSRKSGKWWRKNEKDWPPDRWVEVIRSILDFRPDSRVLLCGSLAERKATQRLIHELQDKRVISITGDANLRRLFALMRVADSMISVDTGPAHAAAALGCPLVVLFGKTDPRDIGPHSSNSPVIIVTGPHNAPEPAGKNEWAKYHSMEGISAQAVINSWQKLEAIVKGNSGP